MERVVRFVAILHGRLSRWVAHHLPWSVILPCYSRVLDEFSIEVMNKAAVQIHPFDALGGQILMFLLQRNERLDDETAMRILRRKGEELQTISGIPMNSDRIALANEFYNRNHDFTIQN